jgi:hypothetical protein
MDYNSLNDFSDLKMAICDLADSLKSIDGKLEDMQYKIDLLHSKTNDLEEKLVEFEKSSKKNTNTSF